MFEEYGQPWSWLIELRPQSSRQGGFTLPASEILLTVQEVYALKGAYGTEACARHIPGVPWVGVFRA